jgi:hypothetical protein
MATATNRGFGARPDGFAAFSKNLSCSPAVLNLYLNAGPAPSPGRWRQPFKSFAINARMQFLKRLPKGDKFSLLILLFITAGLIVYVIARKKNLQNKGVYTKGLIVKIASGVKGNINVYYTFMVDTFKYERFTTTEFCVDCKNSCCDPGDTVIVKYQKDNPNNSALVRISPNREKLYY